MFGQPTENEIRQLTTFRLPVPPSGTLARELLSFWHELSQEEQQRLSLLGGMLRESGGHLFTEYTRYSGRGPYRFVRIGPVPREKMSMAQCAFNSHYTESALVQDYGLSSLPMMFCYYRMDENTEHYCFLQQVTPVLQEIQISNRGLITGILEETSAFNLIQVPARPVLVSRCLHAYLHQNPERLLKIPLGQLNEYVDDITKLLHVCAAFFGNGFIKLTIKNDPFWLQDEVRAYMERLFWAIPESQT
jgi:hypothetical protein